MTAPATRRAMAPQLGDRVHWTSLGSMYGEYPPACRLAFITEVWPPDPAHEQTVSLAVLDPWGLAFRREVEYDEGDPTDDISYFCTTREFPGGTWHHPQP
jgi:hypothetical protein